tara:strand:+ start:102 stop:362 length:261 start_codon:yes stop_codon:yes gene_type:complete
MAQPLALKDFKVVVRVPISIYLASSHYISTRPSASFPYRIYWNWWLCIDGRKLASVQQNLTAGEGKAYLGLLIRAQRNVREAGKSR